MCGHRSPGKRRQEIWIQNLNPWLYASIVSPRRRAGLALERADDLSGDPASVKATRLRAHPLTINITRKPVRIKSQVTFDGCDCVNRVRIAPGRILHALLTRTHCNKWPVPSIHKSCVECQVAGSRTESSQEAGKTSADWRFPVLAWLLASGQ